MPAGRYNMTIERGAALDITFTWRVAADADPERLDPKNLTGWTARAQVRATVDAADPALLDLTTENGGILLGGILGTVQLVATAAQTRAVSVNRGEWALELYDAGGSPTRLLEGDVKVTGELVR